MYDFHTGITIDQLKDKLSKKELTFCPKTFATKRKTSSDVWKKFRIIKIGSRTVPNFVFCAACNEFCAYNGTTTSRLKTHYCSNNIVNNVDQSPIENLDGFEDDQPKKRKITFTREDKDLVRNGAKDFVCDDIRPFYSIQGKGLVSLIYKVVQIAQRYPTLSEADIVELLPSRNTLRNYVISSTQEPRNNISIDLAKALKYPGFFSISMDLWKDSYRGYSYAGICAHINTEEAGGFVRKSYVCCVKHVPETTKTNQIIREHVEEEFEKQYNISRETFRKRVKRITDRGSNVVIAMGHDDEIRLNCYAHIINNIVQKICKVPSVADIIASASSLVSAIKMSGMNCHLYTTLKSHTVTRWNSVYMLLTSILKNYDDLSQLLRAKESDTRKYTYLDKLTCLNRTHLSIISEFLKLFKDLTKMLEGDKRLTLHNVWPSYNLIVQHLGDDEEDTPYLLDMKKAGREYITAHRSDIEPHMEHKLACFLHPQMKALAFANLSDRLAIQNEAITRMESIALCDEPNYVQRLNNSSDVQQPSKRSLFNGFLDNANNSSDDTEGLPTRAIPDYQSEIQNYLLFHVNTVIQITH